MDHKWAVKKVYINGSPTKKPIQRLPWPRDAEDGTPLGVDVEAKREDIIKLTYKHFRVPGVAMEELLQEVFLAILHKNHGNSPHDPRKSSFGHYVVMIARNVCINFVNKRKRLDREKESIDTKMNDDDDRSLLDTYEASLQNPSDDFNDGMNDIETRLRIDGHWELARYIQAARSGSKPEIIREALAWGNRKITTKYVRELRSRITEIVLDYT